MTSQDDLTAERADLSKIIIAESILDNFEAISSYVIRQSLRDMVEENKQLRAALKTARQEALRDALRDLDSLHWKEHWYADQLRKKINDRLTSEGA